MIRVHGPRTGVVSEFAARQLATFDRIEQRSSRFVAGIKMFPVDHLKSRPSPHAWSALEIVDHLKRTESAVRRSCEANIALRPCRVSAVERAKARLFITMVRLPVQVKVPSEVSFVLPCMPHSLQAVLVEWHREHLQFRTLLSPVTARDAGIGVLYHPVVGWLDLSGALSFLLAHLRHHEFQIRRLKLAVLEPANP